MKRVSSAVVVRVALRTLMIAAAAGSWASTQIVTATEPSAEPVPTPTPTSTPPVSLLFGPRPINLHLTYEDFLRIQAMPPQPPSEESLSKAHQPEWREERLAQLDWDRRPRNVIFGTGPDLRKNSLGDFDTYRINPDGKIEGQELFDLIRPKELARFKQELLFSGVQGNAAELYKKYLDKSVNQGMAALMFNRILDEEAMRKKLPPHVSDERVGYAMRSILVENAIQSGLVASHVETVGSSFPAETRPQISAPASGVADRCLAEPPKVLAPATRKSPDQDMSLTPHVELYGYLKAVVGTMLDAQGAKSEEFRAKFRQALEKKEQDLRTRLGATLPLNLSQAERDRQINRQVVLGRDGFTKDVLAAVSADYRAEIDGGTLKVKLVGKPVRFNIGWDYATGGLALDRDHLRYAERDVQWPQLVTLAFQVLPATWQEFESQIREKLEPFNSKVVRTVIWRYLVSRKFPNFSWDQMFSVTTDELNRYYNALKESAFKVQDADAAVSEMVVSGLKADAFRTRFFAAYQAKEQEVMNQLMQNPPAAPSPEEQDRLMREQILALRRVLPKQMVDQIVGEFAADIAAGSLKVEFADRVIHRNGADSMPEDNSIPSQQIRTVFNPAFGLMAIFPKSEIKDNCGAHRTIFLRELTPGQSRYVEITDPRVEEVLRQRIQSKVTGLAFRETAHWLLRLNPFSYRFQTCARDVWGCFTTDARELTEVLIPEVLFTGEDGKPVSLGQEGPGRPITSTLGRSELKGKVQEVDLRLLEKVFDIPNAPRR